MKLKFKITPTQTVEELVNAVEALIERREEVRNRPKTVEELLARKKVKREDL